MNTQQTTVQSNKPTFDGLKAEAAKLGGEAGAGKDGYVKLLIRMMEAAYHGAVDLDENKHGTGKDDAFEVISAYAKHKGIASNFKGKTDNERKLLSNGRKMLKLGQWTKGGAGQPLGNVGDLMIMRNKRFMVDPKTTDDAANSLLRYATSQLKVDTLLDGPQLEQFCRKGVGPEKTAKQIIKGLVKTIDKLGDGSQELKDARSNLVRRINAISIAEVAEKQKQANVPRPNAVVTA